MHFVTTRQPSCRKVMFSVMPVCSQGHVTITRDALDLAVQGPTHAPHTSLTCCTETILPGPTFPLVLTAGGY